MHYRDRRYKCSFLLKFRFPQGGVDGEILNTSRTGMLVRVPGVFSRGTTVTFAMNLQERKASVLRSGNGTIALRLLRPLTQMEFDQITAGRHQRRRREIGTLAEMT